MLEMIQQKSMHRKSETEGLTAFSIASAAVRFSERIRRMASTRRIQMLRDWPPRSSAKDRETCEPVATQWSCRSYREQRSRRGEYHTVMLGLQCVTPWQTIQRERQTLCSVYEWADIFQPKWQW